MFQYNCGVMNEGYKVRYWKQISGLNCISSKIGVGKHLNLNYFRQSKRDFLLASLQKVMVKNNS